jgi:hypothetical protein
MKAKNQLYTSLQILATERLFWISELKIETYNYTPNRKESLNIFGKADVSILFLKCEIKYKKDANTHTVLFGDRSTTGEQAFDMLLNQLFSWLLVGDRFFFTDKILTCGEEIPLYFKWTDGKKNECTLQAGTMEDFKKTWEDMKENYRGFRVRYDHTEKEFVIHKKVKSVNELLSCVGNIETFFIPLRIINQNNFTNSK